MTPDLSTTRSQREKFSRTSRLQHPKQPPSLQATSNWGEDLSRAKPPAGPLKLKLLQFSCNEPQILATTAPNAKVGKTSSERTKLEREHHDPEPWSRSFSARKIFLDFSLTPSEAECNYLHFGSSSAKSLDRIARYLHFSENIFGKSS